MRLVETYTSEEFERHKKNYAEMQKEFDRILIFRVGHGAGLYSELLSMLEAMLWAYMNKVKFILYADHANFSPVNGWTEFFEEFCEMNHSILNMYGNHRTEAGKFVRVRGIPVPNIAPFLLRNFYYAKILKGGGFWTQDFDTRYFSMDNISRFWL